MIPARNREHAEITYREYFPDEQLIKENGVVCIGIKKL